MGLDYGMWVAQEKNIRLKLTGDLLKRWDKFLEEKNIPQQAALEALVRFVLEQDDVGQSLLLKQVKPTPEVLMMVYAKLAPRHRVKITMPNGSTVPLGPRQEQIDPAAEDTTVGQGGSRK